MTWRLLNLASPEFAQKAEPPALCGLIYSGRRHLISGLPESNKTLFSLILGLELLRSSDNTFALIDFESGPEATRLMLTELGATDDELERVLYPEVEGPPGEDDVQALVDAGCTLAIIDASIGAYAASGLDDNQRGDAEAFGRTWIDPLWRVRIASALLDHVVKNNEARGRFAIGSERKAGQSDVHLGLEAKLQLTRGTTGLVRVTTHKDRPGWLTRPYAAEIELQSDPETHAITWQFRQPETTQEAGDHWRPTELMRRVSEYLTTHPEGVSRNEIETRVHGKSNKHKRQAIDELVSLGFATESAGSRNAKIITHVRQYPTSPDLARPRPAKSPTDLATSPPLYRGEVRGEVVGRGQNGNLLGEVA